MCWRGPALDTIVRSRVQPMVAASIWPQALRHGRSLSPPCAPTRKTATTHTPNSLPGHAPAPSRAPRVALTSATHRRGQRLLELWPRVCAETVVCATRAPCTRRRGGIRGGPRCHSVRGWCCGVRSEAAHSISTEASVKLPGRISEQGIDPHKAATGRCLCCSHRGIPAHLPACIFRWGDFPT